MSLCTVQNLANYKSMMPLMKLASCEATEKWQPFLDTDLHHTQNLNNCCLLSLLLHKMSQKFIHNFSSNPARRPTNKKLWVAVIVLTTVVVSVSLTMVSVSLTTVVVSVSLTTVMVSVSLMMMVVIQHIQPLSSRAISEWLLSCGRWAASTTGTRLRGLERPAVSVLEAVLQQAPW